MAEDSEHVVKHDESTISPAYMTLYDIDKKDCILSLCFSGTIQEGDNSPRHHGDCLHNLQGAEKGPDAKELFQNSLEQWSSSVFGNSDTGRNASSFCFGPAAF